MEKFTYRVAKTQSEDSHEQEMGNTYETEEGSREWGMKKNATSWTFSFYKKSKT
jgi:hypothetical protein